MIITVLLLTLLFMGIISSGILLLTKNKQIKYRDEIRIGIIGSVWFTYISWACIYMAQYRPLYLKNEEL